MSATQTWVPNPVFVNQWHRDDYGADHGADRASVLDCSCLAGKLIDIQMQRGPQSIVGLSLSLWSRFSINNNQLKDSEGLIWTHPAQHGNIWLLFMHYAVRLLYLINCFQSIYMILYGPAWSWWMAAFYPILHDILCLWGIYRLGTVITLIYVK